MKRIVVLIVALFLVAVQAAGAKPSSAKVYLTRGEQLGVVERPGATLAPSLRALLAGPTPAEHARGYRTEIPAGTVLRGVSVRDGIARVDLSRRFESGGGTLSMTARLAQLVYTATQFPAVKSVRIALDGKLVDVIGGEGVMVDKPLTRARFAAPAFMPAPKAAPSGGRASGAVRAVQRQLASLGFLAAGHDDGVYGDETRHALIAFQGWNGLPRTGTISAAFRAALAHAARPAALTPDRHVEVSLRRQVALFVDGGRVVRAIHVSTGAAATPTPPGTYNVFRKELRSWSVPFAEWLPYASYFTGGIAFHELADVPAYPASHGCVRVPAAEARYVYAFARLGTKVVVAA